MFHHDESTSRRQFILNSAAGITAGSLLSAVSAPVFAQEQAARTRQATGVKVGEVTDTSAIVWMRLTANAGRNADGQYIRNTAPLPENVRIEQLRGACPGAAGRVRLRYADNEDLQNATSTDWHNVTARTDFSHQFRLTNLRANTTYYFAAETSGPNGNPEHAPLRGRFQTAPGANDYEDVTFTVITGQAYRDLDNQAGYNIYPVMLRLNPKFIIPTGDTVYYDNDGVLASTPEICRHHWDRMYSLPRHVNFHLNVPGYWEKDDHDVYYNDCWPGRRIERMNPMTFERGQAIYREQVPMGEQIYRTFRWGRGLQIWVVEGRDFRSPNNMPDGPNKTIWGREQKQWLMRTMQASNAIFKVLISPTPIVGPDRPNKRDNHANRAFQTEGDEIRRWFQQNLGNERFAV